MIRRSIVGASVPKKYFFACQQSAIENLQNSGHINNKEEFDAHSISRNSQNLNYLSNSLTLTVEIFCLTLTLLLAQSPSRKLRKLRTLPFSSAVIRLPNLTFFRSSSSNTSERQLRKTSSIFSRISRIAPSPRPQLTTHMCALSLKKERAK